MPDLGLQQYVTPVPDQSTLPVETSPTVDMSWLNSPLFKTETNGGFFAPMGENVSDKFYSDSSLFAQKRLTPLTGYNDFIENPQFSPESSDDANRWKYAKNQSRGEWWGNVGHKFWDVTVDAFTEMFKQTERNVSALSEDAYALYSINNKTFQDEENRRKYPTYGTGELDDSGWRFAPWNFGKSDFGGEFIPQLGFTAGTMTAAIIQNAAIEFFSAGTASGLAGARMAASTGKVGSAMWKLFETANGYTNFKKGLQVANTIKNEATWGRRAKTLVTQFPKLFAQTYAIYNTAASEAAFQANMGYTQQMDDLINQHISVYGTPPTEDQRKEMEKNALQKGLAEFGWNLPILMASNLVQFRNLILPFKGAEEDIKLVKNGVKVSNKGKESLLIKKTPPPPSRLEKILQKPVVKSVFESSSELFEETGQGVVTAGTAGYYKSIYEAAHPDLGGTNDMLNSIFDYVGSKASIEDAVGGFMGGMAFQGIGGVARISGIRNTKIGEQLFGPSESTKKKRQEQRREELINILNNANTDEVASYIFDSNVSNFIIQTDLRNKMSEAVAKEDIKEYNNLKAEAVRNFIYTAIQNNSLDLALSLLDTYKELDANEIAEQKKITDPSEIQISKSEIIQKVDDIREQAYKIQETYNSLKRKYGENPYKSSPTKKVLSIAWENAFKERVFLKDAIEQDKRFANNLRKDVVEFSDGVISSNLIDTVVDTNLLKQQIKRLEDIQDNVMDVSDPVYQIQMKQLSLFKEILEEKESAITNKRKKDNVKITQLLEEIADLNKDSNQSGYFFNLHKEENTKRIEDILSIEDRYVDSVQNYNLLNNIPLMASFQHHLDSMQDVADGLKKDAEELARKTKIKQNLSKYKDIPSLVKAYNAMSPADQIAYKEHFTERKKELEAQHSSSQNTSTKKFEVRDGDGNVVSVHDTKEEADKAAALLSKNPPIKDVFTGETPDGEASLKKESATFTNMKLLETRYLTDTSPIAEKYSTKNVNDSEFHRRKDVFLEKLQNNSILNEHGVPYNDEDIKVVVITHENASQYGKNFSTLLTNTDVTDVANVSILLLFVVERNNQFFPVYINGESSIPLSPTFEIDFQNPQEIYSFLDTPSALNLSNERSRNKTNSTITEAEMSAAKKSSIAFRSALLKEKNLQVFNFNISNGVPNRTPSQNSVSHIIPDIKWDSVFVPTTGENGYFQVKLKNGETRNLVIGRPYLVVRNAKGDIINYHYLNNHKLTVEQKELFYVLLDSIQTEYAKTKKPLTEVNYPQINFLKSFLFYSSTPYKSEAVFTLVGDEKGNVSISFDYSKNVPFSTPIIEAKTDASLQSWLENRFFNISKPDNKTFIEYYLNKKGKLVIREWSSYSKYLLSTEGRNTISDIPLTTSVSTPNEIVASYNTKDGQPTKLISLNKQRYIILKPNKNTDIKGTVVPKTITEVVPKSTETNPIYSLSPDEINIEYNSEVAPLLKSDKQFEEFLTSNVDRGENIFTKWAEEAALNGWEYANTENTWVKIFQTALYYEYIQEKNQKEIPVKENWEDVYNNKVKKALKDPEFMAYLQEVWDLPKGADAEMDIFETELSEELNQKAISKNLANGSKEEAALLSKLQEEFQNRRMVFFYKRWESRKSSISTSVQVEEAIQTDAKTKRISQKEVLEELKKIQGIDIITELEQEKGNNDFSLAVQALLEKGETKEKAVQIVWGGISIDSKKKAVLKIIARTLNKKEGGVEKVLEKVLEKNSTAISDISFSPDTLYIAPSKKEEHPAKPGRQRVGRGNSPKSNTKLWRGEDVKDGYSVEDIEKIIQFFAENIPQVSIKISQLLIALSDGRLAWGTYYGNLVTLYESAIAGTGFHEAFEVVFNSLLSTKERTRLLKEMRNRKGSFSNFSTNGTILYSEATDHQLKEELAEEFMRLKLGQPIYKPIRNFLERIWRWVQVSILRRSDIEDVFSKISNKGYAKRELIPTSTLHTKEKKLENLGIVETQQYLEGFSIEFLNIIYKKTGSLTLLDTSFSETEIFDELLGVVDNYYNSFELEGNTHNNTLAVKYRDRINAINSNDALSDIQKDVLFDKLNEEIDAEWEAKKDKWNNNIKPQWKTIVQEQKLFFKQTGLISLQENEEDINENKSQNDYTYDAFKIDIKATAPASIQFLISSIVDSVLDMDTMVEYQNGRFSLPNIVPKYVEATGMGVFTKHSNEIYNILLNKLTHLNDLSLIKTKLEEWLGIDKFIGKSSQEVISQLQKKQAGNKLYTHLLQIYTRIFKKDESALSREEIAQRLKLLSFLSKQSPMFKKQLIGWDGKTFFIDSVTDSGRKEIINRWMKSLKADVFQKEAKRIGLFSKKNKTSPFVIDTKRIEFLLDIKQQDLNKFLRIVSKVLLLNEFIPPAFIDQLSSTEKNDLATYFSNVLNLGFKKLWDGKQGIKLYKFNVNKLGATASMNAIANLILSKQGGTSNSVHTNIDGEQQQNIVLHNTVSLLLDEMRNSSSMENFIQHNPEYKDIYVQDSEILSRIIKEKEDIKLTIVEGTQDSMKNVGESGQDQSLGTRLFQEFNLNLQKDYYTLLPGDSVTETAISYKKQFINYTNSTDIQLELFVYKMMKYLKTEITLAQNFEFSLKANNNRLSKLEAPKKGMVDRQIGRSLVFFNGILSKETLEKIYLDMDNNVSTELIVETYEDEIVQQINDFVSEKVQNTFKDLNNNFFVSRMDNFRIFEDLDTSHNYLFYGLNSEFTQTNAIDTLISEDPSSEEGTVESPGVSVMTGETLYNIILHREINYIISNIEVTKVFFGNPSFYSAFLKRVKSFLSPKQFSYYEKENSSHRFNDWFTHNLNNVQESHPHYHVFKNHLNTWVFKDHYTFNSIPVFNNNNAVDAQSLMLLNAYREFFWKGETPFSELQEKQFQLEQAFDRFLLHEDKILLYKDKDLQKADYALLEGKIKLINGKYTLIEFLAVLPIIKPLGAGFLAEEEQIPFIWKTSVAPLTYSMVRGTALQNVYVSMLFNKIDILTFESAVKTGLMKGKDGVENILDIENFNNLGNSKLNYTSFIHKFPFKTIGKQVETSAQKNSNTQGSQSSKIILTDLFNYGIPRDFMEGNDNFEEVFTAWNNLSEKAKKHQSKYYSLTVEYNNTVEELQNIGYINLIHRLGIEEVLDNEGKVIDFKFNNLSKTYSLLKEEMIKRGLSPNAYGLLEDDNIEVKPLEALANYEQTSFIIMSLVRKEVVKPSLNGGQKIQLSSALLNDLKEEKLKAFYKKGDEYIEITSEEQFLSLSTKEKESITFSSEQLKFYTKNEDGTTAPMEIYISASMLTKVNNYRQVNNLPLLSGEELIEYLNTASPILLEGIGFRIPTQALFSIDGFIIKGFLPVYLGDAVAVPSELTTKAGSDFDVDKLNTYLNNFKINKEGFPELIPPMGIMEATDYYTRKFITNREDILNRKLVLLNLLETYSHIKETNKKRVQKFLQKAPNNFIGYLEQFDTDEEALEVLLENVASLRSELSDKEFKTILVNKNVKKAIENKYFSLIREILFLPINHDKLLERNHSDEFEGEGGIRDEINQVLGRTNEDSSVSVLLDSKQMREIRWALINGKKGIGASANNIVNNIQSQMIGFRINADRTNEFYKYKEIYSSPINFKHNTVKLQDETVSVLSGVKKPTGENIAQFLSKYANGYVDISNSRWVLEIGATVDIVGIFLAMERAGIDSKEISLFMNQPVIQFYLTMQKLRNSPIRRINKDLSKLLSDFSDKGIYTYIYNLTVGADNSPIDIGIFTANKLKEFLISKKGQHFSTWVNGLSEKDKQYQFRVFSQFLIFQEIAKYIHLSQDATNLDTSNINSLYTIDNKQEQLNSLSKSPALITTIKGSRNMSEALLEDTFENNILDVYTILDSFFLSRYLFRAQNKNVREQFRQVMEKITTLYSEDDKRIFMSKLTRVALNIILANSKNSEQTSYIDNIQEILSLERLQELLSSYTVSSKNTIDLVNLPENQWVKNIQINPVDENYGYLSFNNMPTVGSFEEKQWLADFTNLYTNLSTRKLASAIIDAAIIQNGVEFNRNSFTHLIPYTILYKKLDDALQRISNLNNFNLARLVAQMKFFDISFIPELQYLPYKKTDKQIIRPRLGVFKNNQLTGVVEAGRDALKITVSEGEINRILLLPANAYNADLSYFTIKQPHSSFTSATIVEMKKEQNYDYLTKILFEKTPFQVVYLNNKYNVFIPLNVKGDRYIQEAINNNDHSIFSFHEKVNPLLGDYSFLKSAFVESPLNRNDILVLKETSEDIPLYIPSIEISSTPKELPFSIKESSKIPNNAKEVSEEDMNKCLGG